MAKKIKEKGMLHLKGANTLVKKVKKQNPKTKQGKLGLTPLPKDGTGIDPITGTIYKSGR